MGQAAKRLKLVQVPGAGLDRIDHSARELRQPFHELPHVLMTTHVSGWTDGMIETRARAIAGNIERVARGEPPLNAITS